MILAVCLVVAASGLPLPFAAAGEPDFHADLRYRVDTSARGCWDEAEFRRRVIRRLGYDPFRDNARVHVLVHVIGSSPALAGEVAWEDQAGDDMGERHFAPRTVSCAELLAEMTFAVSLQIELLRPEVQPMRAAGPTGAASGSRTMASRAEGKAASPSSPAAQPPRSSRTPPSPRPPAAKPESDDQAPDRVERVAAPASPAPPGHVAQWHVWLGIGPSLAWGIAPSAVATVRLFLGVRHHDLSLEVGAETSYPSDFRRWGGSGFRETLVGGSAGLCDHHGILAGCFLAKAGAMRVQGLGVDISRNPTGFVAQAGLRLAATFGLGDSWSIAVHADGLGLLTPCTVAMDGFGIWEMPWLSAFGGVDLATHFR